MLLKTNYNRPLKRYDPVTSIFIVADGESSFFHATLKYSTALEQPRLVAILFHTKNDNRKILLENGWSKVKDQEMWTEVVKENTTSDGELALVWGPGDLYYPRFIKLQRRN